MSAPKVTRQPFFLNASQGRLFCIGSQPSCPSSKNEGVLIVPPFAEEMNKSRRMISSQAALLAEKGYTVLQFDFYGTGDSEGGFEDATWDIWKQDLVSVIDWLNSTGINRIHLLAIRMGALLVDYILDTSPVDISTLVFWQPIAQGETLLNQFYRLKMAADMVGDPKGRMTTKDIKERLMSGNNVEIAGYTLNPKLVDGISKENLTTLSPKKPLTIYWFEISGSVERPILPASQKVIDELSNQDRVRVIPKTILGAPFWSSGEIVEIQQLYTSTISAIQESSNAN